MRKFSLFYREKKMKKLLVGLLMSFLFSISAWAAVDLNTASQGELQKVKGIGPAKAKAIVEYREKNGSFKSVDELDKVRGFGKATVGKLRGDLTVGGKAEGKAEAARPETAKAKK
jgi:competence protein ComEA